MVIRAALLVAAALLASCGNLRVQRAIDRLHPCKHAEGPSEGYCGTLEVWENRQAKTGRKIPLKIVVFPALKRSAAPDPVFFLAGGPGQGAASIAEQGREILRRAAAGRDLVFVDQRGTGKSNPLECDEAADEEGVEAAVARLRACLEKLKQTADLTKYTTPIAMADLEQVRQFLGYGKINLYGGSYGTRAAMAFARRYPASTRAVVLDGVAPPGMRLPLYMARDSQRALDLLFRDCEASKPCRERFPRLRERLDKLLAAPPRRIRITHPRSGAEKEAEIRRLTLGSAIFSALYSPKLAALIPLVIEQAERGDYAGFFALGGAVESTSSSIAQGMHLSVVCSEDAPRITAGAVERETAGSFLGAEMAAIRLKICEFWPKAEVDPAYFDDAPIPAPTLVLSGELDPVTPPSWGEQAAALARDSRHIVVPFTGHGAAAGGCVPKLVAQFIDEASTARLDTACVKEIRRPPFFLGPAGPEPKPAMDIAK